MFGHARMTSQGSMTGRAFGRHNSTISGSQSVYVLLHRPALHYAVILAVTGAMPVDAAPARIVDSQGQNYFPQDAAKTIPECRYSWTKEPLKQVAVFDVDNQLQVARSLRAAREPSLIGKARSGEYPEAYRLTWSFGMWSTVTVRIELGPKKSRMTAKQATVFYNELTRRKSRSLTDAEVSRFRSLLDQGRFFGQRPGSCKLLVDGTNWFFESAKPNEFDFVERGSPAASETAFILGKFLFDLTGWKSGLLYRELQQTQPDDDDPDSYEYDY